jgi:hypothetical protein
VKSGRLTLSPEKSNRQGRLTNPIDQVYALQRIPDVTGPAP